MTTTQPAVASSPDFAVLTVPTILGNGKAAQRHYGYFRVASAAGDFSLYLHIGKRLPIPDGWRRTLTDIIKSPFGDDTSGTVYQFFIFDQEA